MLAVRRAVFFVLVMVLATVLVALAACAVAPGGVTTFEWLTLIAFAGTAPWTALCGANALIGLALLLGARDPARAVLPALAHTAPGLPRAHTAIAVCIRNEDMAEVLPPLRRLVCGLAEAGAEARFTLWFLSDTRDTATAIAEEAAIRTIPGARYRRRADNSGFKAGNVMEFLDHHAGEAEFMICLDADSEMSAEAVLRLVAIMEADTKLAIVQQLIVGRPASAAFPRLFQFGMRAGMRAWATGQAWWQADQGPYWGHNAIIRIAPFRQHARLEPLPDGSPILSHDQVEATRLTHAGWKVMALPIEDGSMEGNPPALPEFMARDMRWGAGNMQYWALLKLPRLTALGRWQLVQAILLFAGTPLWTLALLFAVLNAATGGGLGTDSAWLAAAMAGCWACIHAPKLCGYAEVLLKPGLAARYGGRARFLRGAAAELLFTTLLDPVSTFNKALFLAVLPFRRLRGWAPQNRADRGVGWGDAARLLWPHTLFGALCFALVPVAAWPWLAPWALGLVLAVPFCVMTSSPGFSARLRSRRVAATPEELAQNQ
ncbi:glucans biosynthesis glucosyltransferase MdoH [Rhodovarius crocodyli]|nr:glucans biosynthesis glucosyltransferase MdoH [Rhodovarius crocodyli]